MAPSSAAEGENEQAPQSPTESVISTVSSDGEGAIRNIGKKSLAQEIEDVMERENRNRNGDTQTVAESSVGHEILASFLGCPAEDLPSELTFHEILKIQERVQQEKWDALGLPELTTTTILVSAIICCLLVLGAASYAY
ncbi:uncharacterized protein FMAN_15256 [Fusarium mangiferae]|uniref:Uncharacterized protein n=1 Tax=Fusarium mangiferae TaxID=192010 RepID=A0A1L7UH81_FUSMA|nr:uncharacterized protein FMAN_15256 [Fusarium mangiferae]CVL07087.1 uncharacterized protein FMAN_15256 [Fusarium mangiferae]